MEKIELVSKYNILNGISDRHIIDRKEFDKELNRIKNTRVSYVISPAGWGKTTSVKNYLSIYSDYDEIYWYSLTTFDNQNPNFSDYEILITDNTDENNHQQIKTNFSTLIKRISNTQRKILIVLDDFHFITNKSIIEAVSTVIKNSAPTSKYIVISRNAVPIEMGGLLASGNFQIVSNDKLRFSKDEIKEYYNKNDIEVDQECTEQISVASNGWPAAINVILMAFKLNGNNLTKETFNLAEDYINNYIEVEFFSKLSKKVQTILVKVAITNEINLDLVQIITGEDKSEIINAIKYISTFVAKVDENNYVCHDILLNFLREQYQNYCDEDKKIYYKKIGEWFKERGDSIQAVDNFLKAEDFESATKLMEPIAQINMTQNLYYDIESYVRAIPVEYLRNSVILSAFMIRLEIAGGDFANAESWYNNLISLRKACEPSTPEAKFLESNIAYALLVLPRIGCEDILKILPRIIKDIREGEYQPRKLTITNCFPSILHGVKDLSDFSFNYKELGSFLKPIIEQMYPKYGYGAVSIGTGEYLYYINRIGESLFQLADGAVKSSEVVCPETMFVAYANLCKLSLISKKIDESDEYQRKIHEAIESNMAFHLMPNFRAFCAQTGIYKNDKEYIWDWMENYAPKDDETKRYFYLYQFLSKAKVYLYLGEYDKALILSKSILTWVDKLKRPLDISECSTIQAIACYGIGDKTSAFEMIEKALVITQKYGYIRVISDFGYATFNILTEYLKKDDRNQDINEKYVKEIIASAKNMSVLYPSLYVQKSTPVVDEIELSNTELKILHLLDEGKSNAEIADEINVKLPTVKYHMKNIFTKLDAKNRVSALNNAKQAGYL